MQQEVSAMTEQEFTEQLKVSENMIDSICNNYCYKYNRKDLMQDIALELWKTVGNFKNNCKFSSWIHAVARNVCVSTLRKLEKQPIIECVDEYKEVLEEHDNTNELLKQLQDAQRYNSVLNSIEEPYRTLFHMYVYGASFKELARYSGLTENSLRVRIHRIKKQLQLHYWNNVIN